MEIEKDNKELQTVLSIIRDTNESLFLTGKAGTGKSSFVRYLVENISKNFVIVAPTGIAAINIGGVTINSLFQLPFRPLLPEDKGIKIFNKRSLKREIIKKMDTLIIDEISMVRVDVIDAIDYSLRKNGGNPLLPFGGKQILFVGDLFQLEPVMNKRAGELEIIKDFYDSPYFYNAKVFNRIKLITIELNKVYRQQDYKFIDLLDKIRKKKISKCDIDILNSHLATEKELNGDEFIVTLCTVNEIANDVNTKKLAKIDKIPFFYVAEVNGDFEDAKYPAEFELELKIGAQVIFLKNDPNKRWVNGTIGKIHMLSTCSVEVILENGSIYTVEKQVWENIRFVYNKAKKTIDSEVIGTFSQYPLKLAWALTINKSQGMTFNKVIVDFYEGTFASGQAYVALSRVTTFDGLFLKRKVQLNDIRVDEEIINFSESFNTDSIDIIIEQGKLTFFLLTNKQYNQLGEYYLGCANKEILNRNFKNAYKLIINAYSHIICDCGFGIKNMNGLIDVINNIDFINCEIYQLNLIQVYVYILYQEFDKALVCVNNLFLNKKEDELSYYFKGRIYEALGKNKKALKFLNKALQICMTNKVLYRIGRVKEKLNMNGIPELYKASIAGAEINHCVAFLAESLRKNGVSLHIKNNQYVDFFNSNSNYFYILYYEYAIRDFDSYQKRDMNRIEGIKHFIDIIANNSNIFLNDRKTEERDVYYDNEYSTSYEEFGGYHGYDDDTINSAFEGDPTNVWNIE